MRQFIPMSGTIGAWLPCLTLAVGLVLVADPGRANEPTPIRVNAFPNAKALPLHAGIAKGIFDKRSFKIELHLTENSRN